MEICIGIVTHNRATILEAAIRSALTQDYPAKEVIVFDDASTDRTPSLRMQFPTVRWIRSNKSRGYRRARNIMMRLTRADLYCSLDDDAWFVAGDELTQVVRQFTSNSRLAAVAFDILSPDRPQVEHRSSPRGTHVFIGCGHVLRLKAVAALGYYESNPTAYGGEETDLCLRLLDQDNDLMLLPGVHVWHDKTPLARDLVAQHRSAVCNDLAFALRRIPMPMVLWTIPGKMMSHLRFAVRHGFVRPCLQGMRIFARHVPALLASRMPVRAATLRDFYRRRALASQ